MNYRKQPHWALNTLSGMYCSTVQNVYAGKLHYMWYILYNRMAATVYSLGMWFASCE